MMNTEYKSDRKKDTISFSIIMPTYNVEKYVKGSIESVLAQNYSNYELICVDNASEDGTVSILNDYAEQESRMHVLRNERNEGISFSRNRGIEAAQGEYILFLDADDKLAENALERIAVIATEEKMDILFFDAIAEYENEELKEKFGHYIPNREGMHFEAGSGQKMFAAFIKENRYTDVLWRQCFKKEFLDREGLRFTKGRLHEDVVFSFRAILSAKKTVCVQEEFYVYYRREGSLTAGENILDAFRCEFTNYCNMVRFWQRSELSEEGNEAVKKYLDHYYNFLNGKYRYAKGIKRVEFEGCFENHMYQSFILNSNLLGEHMEEIAKYDKIIIYGAGYIAERILKEYNSKKIIGIAVTEMGSNPTEKYGYRVKELRRYKRYAKRALVIICVIRKTQGEMIQKLQEEGFLNYICAV